VPPHKPLSLLARGYLMGAADLVPGVSGGTVALVTGIYEELIDTVRLAAAAVGHLLRADLPGMRARLGEIRWLFILPLGAGILLALLSLARGLEHLLETEPVRMAGLFFGLVAGSVIAALPRVRHWDGGRVVSLAITAMVAFVVLGFRATDITDPPLLAYFFAGAIAICAMILPGISGSFILLMLGMYDLVLEALNDRELLILGVFTLGCAVGLMSFSQVLHWALDNFHDLVVASLIGLMIGSLRVLWPWPDGTEGTAMSWPSGDVLAPVVLAIVGFAVVVTFTVVADRLERRADSAEPAES
jgi:putative membrane protein